MTTDEVIDLLTLAAGYDRRKVGESDVAAWMLAVGDLPSGDAQAAVAAHYRDSAEWLMPAHVRTRVKAIRAERIARAAIPAPDPDLDPAAYRAALAASVRMAGDGLLPDAEPLPAIGPAPGERRNGQPASLASVMADLRAAFGGRRRGLPSPQELAVAQAAEARERREAGEPA